MAFPPIIQGASLYGIVSSPASNRRLIESGLSRVSNPKGETYDFKKTTVIFNTQNRNGNTEIYTKEKDALETPCFEYFRPVDPNRNITLEFLHTCKIRLAVKLNGESTVVFPKAGQVNEYSLSQLFPSPEAPRVEYQAPNDCCTIL
jgi:hypothetical protein